MDRDSMGELETLQRPTQSNKSSAKSPLRETFVEVHAKQVTLRLLANWPNDKALTNEQLRQIREAEYVEAFRGKIVSEVFDAVGRAIRGATHGAPSISDITGHLPKPTEARPSDRYSHRPWYDYSGIPKTALDAPDHPIYGCARRLMRQGCAPEYIMFRERERAIMQETVAKMDAMSPETYRRLHGGYSPDFKSNAKLARAVVAGLEG